jgi:hypothetical protein
MDAGNDDDGAAPARSSGGMSVEAGSVPDRVPETGAMPAASRASARPAKPEAITIEADLDVRHAIDVHAALLSRLDGGAEVLLEIEDGRPTQPALQIVFAARKSAAAGRPIRLGPRALSIAGTARVEGDAI